MVLLEHAACQSPVSGGGLGLQDHRADNVQDPEEGEERAGELPQALAGDDAHRGALKDGEGAHVLRVVQLRLRVGVRVLGQVAHAGHEGAEHAPDGLRLGVAHDFAPAELQALYLVHQLPEGELAYGLREEVHQRGARQLRGDDEGGAVRVLHALYHREQHREDVPLVHVAQALAHLFVAVEPPEPPLPQGLARVGLGEVPKGDRVRVYLL